MKHNVGEHVVYCSKEICLINGIVKKCFDGINEEDYFQLIPINTKNSFYYIPCNNCEAKIRSLLTKEEIYKLIDEMPDASAEWCDDRQARKNLFNSILKSDDYHKIINMIHSLYIKRENQTSIGKKLLATDERAMNEAEHIINQEFAFVLEINEDEVDNFIKERLKNNEESFS